jgi:UDP-glucose 4-epimerase
LRSPESKQGAVVITGAGGYIGKLLVDVLAKKGGRLTHIVAADIREIAPKERKQGVTYITADVRFPKIFDIFREHKVSTVVHLASIVTPERGVSREFLYSVDVCGTENTLKACIETKVQKLIIASSGAAYGYYPDNPEWISETDTLRGNPEFAYSDHKRLVEEMLARYRKEHPELKQLIFRPGTILGATTDNQITRLFRKSYILGLQGAAAPFVFIWDQDVVNCIVKGIHEDITGIFNMAGDGVLTLKEIASILKKPYMPLPVWLVKASLWVLSRLKLSQYGPEQVNFIRYRPVLSNQRLKDEFGYIPRKTSRQVFEYYMNKGAIDKKIQC